MDKAGADGARLDTTKLIERFVTGETQALGEIWRRHERRMRTIVRLYLRPYPSLRRRQGWMTSFTTSSAT
jgi:hypothetical protein